MAGKTIMEMGELDVVRKPGEETVWTEISIRYEFDRIIKSTAMRNNRKQKKKIVPFQRLKIADQLSECRTINKSTHANRTPKSDFIFRPI